MQEHVQVDPSKCKACRRCEFACIASHHGIDIKTAMKMKDTYSPRCWAFKGDDYKTSVRCHGCNPAPCCAICPTGALEQHKDGTFTINRELCAGCMMCMAACPYGVISPEMISKSDPQALSAGDKVAIAVRCDLCHDWRAAKGVEYTACMEACMTRALVLVRSDGTIVEAPPVEKKAPKPQVAEKTAAPQAEAPKAAAPQAEAPKAAAPQAEAPKAAAPQAEAAPRAQAAPKAAPKESVSVKVEPASDAVKPSDDEKKGKKPVGKKKK